MSIGETINNQNQFNVGEVQVHHHSRQQVYHQGTNIYDTCIVTGDQSTSLKAIEGMALSQGTLLYWFCTM